MSAFKSIVVSGQPVSGKSTLVERLSKEYAWPSLSLGGIWRARWKEKYPKGEIPFEEYWRGTTTEDNMKVNVEAKEIFERGGIIGDSRYSSYLDAHACLLIFVTAPREIRARRGMGRVDYRGKSYEETLKILARREEDEIRTGKELFVVDYRDPSLYHAVLNSGVLRVDEEVAIVKCLMENRAIGIGINP